jgi:hypothetical protein
MWSRRGPIATQLDPVGVLPAVWGAVEASAAERYGTVRDGPNTGEQLPSLLR